MTWTTAGRVTLSILTTLMLGACGTAPPVAPPAAGWEAGDPAAITVYALDEVTRLGLPDATVTFWGATGVLGSARTDEAGRAVLTSTDEVMAIEVAESQHVSERWTGTGRSVVIPMQRHASTRRVSGTLTHLVGTGSWTVIATAPARVFHVASFIPTASGICEVADGACSFAFDAPIDDTTSFLAFMLDDAGVPQEVRILGTLSDAMDLSLAEHFSVVEHDVSTPVPGIGATAVVGVPGLAVNGRVALFPWSAPDGSLFVPDTDDAFGSTWALFSSTQEDGSHSVLVQRGVGVGPLTWTAWMAAPSLDSATWSLSVPEEAELVAIAWYADSNLLRHDLSSPGTEVVPADGATRAVVRAIDTLALDGGHLDLDALERATTRIADRAIELR